MKRTGSISSSETASRKKHTGASSRWSSDEEDEAEVTVVSSKDEEVDNGGHATTSDPLEDGGKSAQLQGEGATGAVRGHANESAATVVYNPLFHGCRSVDNYQRLNYISSGTYGDVFRAKDTTTGDIVALKQIKFDKWITKTGFPKSALREINILLALQHPNIIRVREMVIGSAADKIFMVMDYMENDLRYCMDSMPIPFSLAETKSLLLQILRAVDYMHEHWYIHRDLKTSNILYGNNGNVVVCDFGMARKYGSPLQPYTFEVITLGYRPLELLLGQRNYSTAVDMWSVGCIFAEVLTRKPLFPVFQGDSETGHISTICKILGAPNENNMPGVSNLPGCAGLSSRLPSKSKLRELFPHKSFTGGAYLNDTGFDLLSRMLLYDSNVRISSRDAVNHPWFSEPPLACPKEMLPTFKSRHEAVKVLEEL